MVQKESIKTQNMKNKKQLQKVNRVKTSMQSNSRPKLKVLKGKGKEKVKQPQGWIVEDDSDFEDSGNSSSGLKDVGVVSSRPSGKVWDISFKSDLEIKDYDDLGANLINTDTKEANNSTIGNNVTLVESIQQISATRRTSTKRKEASKNVEEFVAVKKRVVGDGGINKFLDSVTETGDAKTAEKVAKLVSAAQTSKILKKKSIKTLDTPEHKFTTDKVKRSVLYNNAKEEISQWNAVVYHNRSAEQLVFPLGSDNKGFKKAKKHKSEFMPVTPLEEEIAKVLYGEDYLQRKKAEMAKDPEKTDMESYLLTVEEAMATHSEMAKLRALQSYAMSKAKRQNKIKSKKYHRLLRKSKIKQQMKEFEELQKTDPEGALLKLEELERSRVQERMSLKHRNTTKWAKMQSARAKYDKNSRIALSEQLKISRDLTQKIKESSEDEDEEDTELPTLVKSSVENPWMLKPSLEENDKLQMYYTGYRKFWEDYNRQLSKKSQESVPDEESNEEANDSTLVCDSNNLDPTNKDGDVDEIRDLNINEEEINSESITVEDTSKSKIKKNQTNKVQEENSTQLPVEVNPDNFLKIVKTGSSIAPQFNAENSQALELLEEDSDDESQQRNLIAEAFEDDDVVNKFRKQKNAKVEADKPQDIDNFLPGWGSWTGKDITHGPKRRKRFVKKAKKQPPRKDARVSHVIINEDVDNKVRAHQVKDVPFPFTRVKDFEKSIRAPIGRTWMPEHAVKSLTAPKVITRLGGVIKPISDDVLVKSKEKNKKFHVPNTIIKMANVVNKV